VRSCSTEAMQITGRSAGPLDFASKLAFAFCTTRRPNKWYLAASHFDSTLQLTLPIPAETSPLVLRVVGWWAAQVKYALRPSQAC